MLFRSTKTPPSNKTEALGLARKSIILRDDVLDKTAKDFNELKTGAEREKFLADMKRRAFDETNPMLAMHKIGDGDDASMVFLRTEWGNPVSAAIMNQNAAFNEVLARHGLMTDVRLVDSATGFELRDLGGVEVTMEELSEIEADPLSVRSSKIAGAANINMGDRKSVV